MAEAGGSFDAVERRALQEALASGAPLLCPRCAVPLTQQRVDPGGVVAYVRRRRLVICPTCRRSASLDVKREQA
jgi:hypothetical protein